MRAALTETTEQRISFVDMHGNHVVYDRMGHCAACSKCLCGSWGRCPWGGPFNARLEVDRASFIPLSQF